MFAHALIAFLVLPGVLAFLVPALLSAPYSRPSGLELLGAFPFALGVAGLLACVREFYVTGMGTLAPWSPPRHLVTTGLYTVTRNPMYLSVVLILVGWATMFTRPVLWFYALAVAVGFHVRVVVAEEPWLERTFGSAWSAYRASVPRWLVGH